MNVNADKINSLLTMADIVKKYGFETERGFIRCPFHSERTASLKLYPDGKGWYCFGCGAGGNLINFVMRLFSLNFNQAVQRIDYDFNLNLALSGRMTVRQRRRAELEINLINKQKELEAQHENELTERWLNALKRYTDLDLQRRKYAPEVGDVELHPLFAEAIKNIEFAAYEVEAAEEERRTYGK